MHSALGLDWTAHCAPRPTISTDELILMKKGEEWMVTKGNSGGSELVNGGRQGRERQARTSRHRRRRGGGLHDSANFF